MGVDRKTARRYILAAIGLGGDRDGGEEQLTDELIGQMVERVRSHRPDGHGPAWRTLLGEEERIKAWVDEDLTVVKLGILLIRVSMLRTMELILGVGPLTQQDSAASPMFASFSDSPDATPFAALTPQRSLHELNTIGAPLAGASATMDFSGVDRAPHRLLNEAIWRSVKGVDSRMLPPKTTRAARDHS